jgi:hypothetical protein
LTLPIAGYSPGPPRLRTSLASPIGLQSSQTPPGRAASVSKQHAQHAGGWRRRR